MLLKLCGLVSFLTCANCVLFATNAVVSQPANNLPLAEGKTGVVVGTTGPLAVHAGIKILQNGGSAADAAMATSLAQVVECGGSYVSHAGILTMIYYEAATGKVHYMNACYDTPRQEKEPKTIPRRGTPSGRTALVPGFMAGVDQAQQKFGKLSREDVFQPAIKMASEGIKVNALLARFLPVRKDVLSRLPQTRSVFTKADGSWYQLGDLFRQPQLADTLKNVAKDGAAYMYSGEWAKKFVEAVRKEGGKMTMEDMQSYQVIWETPLQTTYRGHQIFVPGHSSQGGVCMIEALHLLELTDLPSRGHYSQSPVSLFWLMQISHNQVLSFLDETHLAQFHGLDLRPPSRVKRKTATSVWKLMQAGTWPFAGKLLSSDQLPPNHSDGVVVADRWGNLAVVTHSINTTLWGDTGLFVGGVSIPDSASYQQDAIFRIGPGKRLPDPTCPLLVMKDGKPMLGSSAIGGGLHQRTLQVLCSVLDFNLDPQSAVEMPAFMLPAFGAGVPTPQVEKGVFDIKLMEALKTKGQSFKELTPLESGAFRGYWIGVHFNSHQTRRGIGTRKPPLPSIAEAY